MKNIKKANFKAHFENILVKVDEPQVIHLKTMGSSHIVAVAGGVYEEDGESTYPFYGSNISHDQWIMYLREEVDLRYLIRFPRYKKWFKFNLNQFDSSGWIHLRPFSIITKEMEEFIPDSGFFARYHTQKVGAGMYPDGILRFEVDGSWKLRDFSYFNAKISDVYAFFAGLLKWDDDALDVDDRKEIRNAFTRPWQGGGSYLGFFKSLFANLPSSEKLYVKKIQYASPGAIELKGDSLTFVEFEKVFENYLNNHEEVDMRYRSYYGYLSKNKLLKLSADEYDVASDEASVMKVWVKELLIALGIDRFDTIYALSDGNPLISIKVVMALVRRLESLKKFVDEGRAALAS